MTHAHPPLLPSVVGIVQRQYSSTKPRVRRLPGATPQILYTTPTTMSGQPGTLTLTFTPSIGPPPPPPPVPGDPVITYYLGPGRTPLPANVTVPVSTMLFINGSSFGQAQGTVVGEGKSLRIMTWGGSEIGVILPDQPTGGAKLILTVTRADGRSVSGASVALSGGTPIPPPPPPPPVTQPQIRSYRDEQGNAGVYFPEGSRIHVMGEGFGAAPGSLYLAGAPFSFTSWSDTEVDFTAPQATIPGSTISTSAWETVGIMRADRKAYTDQWGVKFQQPRRVPLATQDADPIPLPWASEPPVWVETQPFAVSGKYYDLQIQIKPAPGIAPNPPPSPLPPVVTSPVIAGGCYWTLEITPVPAAGGPPAGQVR